LSAILHLLLYLGRRRYQGLSKHSTE